MKLAFMTAAALAVMGAATTAQAGEAGQTYGNLGAVWYDVDSSAFGIIGRLGHGFTENFAVEAEGSVGVIDDNGVGVNYSIAGFGLIGAPVSDTVDLFLRVGYHNTEFGAGNASGSDDGVAYGAGANFWFNDVSAIRADYTRYEVGAGGLTASSDTISASYVRKF